MWLWCEGNVGVKIAYRIWRRSSWKNRKELWMWHWNECQIKRRYRWLVLTVAALCSDSVGASLWTARFSHLNVSTRQAVYKFHTSERVCSSPLTFRLLPAETQHLLSKKRHHISHKWLFVYKSGSNKLYMPFNNTFSLCTPVLSNNATIRVDKFAKDKYVFHLNSLHDSAFKAIFSDAIPMILGSPESL
jgi:hypothetical protein